MPPRCKGDLPVTGLSACADLHVYKDSFLCRSALLESLNGIARIKPRGHIKRRVPMGKYIVKRVLYIILVFFILSFMIYMIYNMLPIDKAAEAAKTEVQANRKLDYNERLEFWKRRYGTDGTKLERYFRWLGIYPFYDGRYDGLLQGNLGQSTKYGQPVIEVLVEPMKNTIFINIFATILALGITIPLGIFCAVKRGSRRDVAVQVGTIIGYSLPTFIIAIVFIWLFAVVLGWFPVSGMTTAGSLHWSKSKQFWDKMYHWHCRL